MYSHRCTTFSSENNTLLCGIYSLYAPCYCVCYLSYRFYWVQAVLYLNCTLKTFVYSHRGTTFSSENNTLLCGIYSLYAPCYCVRYLSYRFYWVQAVLYLNCKLKTFVYSRRCTTFSSENNTLLCGIYSLYAPCCCVRYLSYRFYWVQAVLYLNCTLKTFVYSHRGTTFSSENNTLLFGIYSLYAPCYCVRYLSYRFYWVQAVLYLNCTLKPFVYSHRGTTFSSENNTLLCGIYSLYAPCYCVRYLSYRFY